MITDPNFSFHTCISVEGYTCKTDATACLSKAGADAVGMNKMAFKPHKVTVDEFLQYATSGHAFSNIFAFDPNQKYWVTTSSGKHYESYPVYRVGPNKGAMKLSFKSDQFLYGAQAVYVDVDHTRFTAVPDYLDTLTYRPTCVYMSFSDGKAKGKNGVVSRRFRLVYVLDQIYRPDDLLRIATGLTEQIVIDTAEPMADDCGERPCQYMNGVYGNNETYKTDIIYTVDDFPQLSEPPSLPPSTQASGPEIEFDDELVREMEMNDYATVTHYNSWKYPYIYRTERPDEWIDGKYQMTDENYLQLWYHRERLMDGMHRRRNLFINACIRRLICPWIDADTLLYNLYIDRERFFDNSDGVLTLKALMFRVKRAMVMTPEQLRAYCDWEIRYWKVNRPAFIIHPSFKGLRGMASSIAKKIRWEEIDRVYDKSLSLNENLETNLADLDISARTLYRYCKERFIDTDPDRPQMTAREKREAKRLEKTRNIERFKDLYDPDLSLRKNKQIMEDAGLEISLTQMRRWIDKYITPATPMDEPPTWGTVPFTPPDFSSWKESMNAGTFGITVSDWDMAAEAEPKPCQQQQPVAFQPFHWEAPHFELPPVW